MSKFISDRKYDKERGIFVVNDRDYTNHCHRFMAVAIRTAMDAKKIVDGPKILEHAVEDSMRNIFIETIEKQKAESIQEKIELIESYYSWAGLGVISFDAVSESGGEVTLTHSHVDEAWKLMIGEAKEPLNFITSGFIAAAFGVLYQKQERCYQVKEVESIVLGSEKSVFKINLP